jgi:hypothetical protein
MHVFVEEDNVDFGIDEVGAMSNGTASVMSYGIVGVVFDGVASVAFDCAMGVYVHLGVCFVGVTFGSLFYILIGFLLLSLMFLCLLEINIKWPIKFLMLVLFLWIEGKMWCRLQIMALVDLEM